MQHAQAEQVEVGPAEHGPLDSFQAIDLPFGLALTPGLGDPGFYGGAVLPHPEGEALQFRDIAVLRRREPDCQRAAVVGLDDMLELGDEPLGRLHRGAGVQQGGAVGLIRLIQGGDRAQQQEAHLPRRAVGPP